jgi:putative pyoverdin transport system ATP-binding/permease protein
MKFFQFILKTSWQTILIATLLGLISGGGNATLISLVNRAVEQASISQSLLYFFGLLCFTLGVSTFSQFILISLSQKAIYQLRLQLSRGILSSPLHHIEQLGDHRLLASLTDDVRALSQTVAVLPNLCVDLATICGCLAYLAWLSGSVFALLIVITFGAIWGIQATIHKAQHLFSIAREEEDSLFKHFRAMTSGTKELKLHYLRREDFLEGDLQVSAAKLRQKNTKAMKIFAIADGLGQFALFSILGLILFALPRFVPISTPMLSSYALTITYLTVPFQNLLHRLPDIMRGSVAIRKVERMKLALDTQSELTIMPAQSVYSRCQLSLSEVTYHYQPEGEESGFRLGPINLVLEPGQITYLIGGNGSGKSTIAKLITGLYAPASGSICLNELPITDLNREWYRQHFSAVFSDFYLFDRCLGIDCASRDQEVTTYLKQLHLDHKVHIRNGVLSTTRLSQGQRKRLALLTVYLEDRPIYLFDEWAADQEPAFRELFYTQILLKLKERGKTVLVITHDDRYFHLADQMLKLDYGQIQSHRLPVTV